MFAINYLLVGTHNEAIESHVLLEAGEVPAAMEALNTYFNARIAQGYHLVDCEITPVVEL